jgi:pSer/pThr/pTyr-binding forkhead associated (FHA) protein
VGRDTKSDVFLDDVTVSRAHARIDRRDRAFFVKDLGSLNGTYVNGEAVEETKLARGDEVQSGKFKLVFFWAGE